MKASAAGMDDVERGNYCVAVASRMVPGQVEKSRHEDLGGDG